MMTEAQKIEGRDDSVWDDSIDTLEMSIQVVSELEAMLEELQDAPTTSNGTANDDALLAC